MILFKLLLVMALLAWLLAMWVAYGDGTVGRRMMQHSARSDDPLQTPPLSVVIATHNQATALRRYLPEILDQDYERFEVIVVDMKSDDETMDVLERLEQQYAYLHHASVPTSARDISLERLALTLGFRAAIHEWVVITRPDCHPATSLWLRRIAETIAAPKTGLKSPHLQQPDMVLGFTRYDEQRQTPLDYKTGYHRLWHTLSNLREIISGNAAVHADSCNLAFRKSLFLEHRGFADAQNLKAGAIELLVNHNSTPSNTALLLSPTAHVLQDRIATERQWKQLRVINDETLRHERHTAYHRFKSLLRMCSLWIFILFGILPVVVAVHVLPEVSQTEAIVTYITLFILLISYISTKLKCFHITTRALGCRSYYLSLLWFELCLPFWEISTRMAHGMASRNEFRKKFV